MKSDCCHGKKTDYKCGEFKGEESKEEKLKHLQECKEELQKKINDIDEAIATINN